MRALYFCLTLSLSTSILSHAHANPSFLSADQAFQFSAESISKDKVQLHWNIAPHYYLYHDQFKVQINDRTSIKLKLPQGHQKDDPTFGQTEVHYDQVSAEFSTQANTQYRISWQGCSQDGLCYPLQNQSLSTDQDGLIPQQNSNTTREQNQNELFKSTQSSSNLLNNTQDLNTSSPELETTTSDNTLQLSKKPTVLNDAAITQSASLNQSIQEDNTDLSNNNKHTSSLQWNDDQSFLHLLSKDSIFLNIFVFLGLGILLAFLPCSLPLIPIISTLILQRRSGYKAFAIVSSFILSMALVYGLMGVFVAEIGYSFQRWFQNPIVISIFACLFILFALNLFGLFQLSLPQRWINKLNQFQDQQKAGTLFGSITMGALSALIVGPCMSAPLAGALLFVSQSHNAFLGGLYLFILGLGIGLPLFIASLFGTRLLPKPGLWMNHLKVCFGFLMLCMAIYFVRPMLSSFIYDALFAITALALTVYLFKVIKDSQSALSKVLIIIGILCSFTATLWFAHQAYQTRMLVQQPMNLKLWQQVSNESELKQALNAAKSTHKMAIVDVYADWCVACQPLEKEVFPRADVQNALASFQLIKLDLSQYEKSQDLILKQHEILGPPTLLIFDAQGNEQRNLRLTGTFKAEQLIQQLKKSQNIQ